MKTTFGELKIGERFHYNIDADGHEPYLYKINDTEAYIEHGRRSGLRESVNADENVWTWDEPVEIHPSPTEVERAAITLLMHRDGPNANHPGLRQYVLALASDQNEMRDLDQFIWEAEIDWGSGGEYTKQPLHQICHELGYICWENEWDRENSAFGAILDHKPTGRRPDTREGRWLAKNDDAALRLADAIANYRIAGRPSGDQTHTISGMGSPLLSVTSSLAAAIGEYHEQMLNVYAGEAQNLEMALRQIMPDDLITQTEAARIANITPQAINNAIRARRLRAYSDVDSVSHRPGDRRVSEADVRQLWPPRE